jgi:cytochrome P450
MQWSAQQKGLRRSCPATSRSPRKVWLSYDPFTHPSLLQGKDYKFLHSWLGTGLLTSTGTKWHTRRKMLTPAFHFRILEDFLDVMNQQTELLCDILDPLCGGPAFDVFSLVTHCALDIICETAMGKSINAQADSDTDYVRAIYAASDIVFQRQKSPWLWQDWLFALTPAGFRWRKYLKSLHGLTTKVIEERKKEVETTKSGNTEDDVGIKRRLAFLDLLIDASEGGSVLSDEDIREEVDTFMFEGKACSIIR